MPYTAGWRESALHERREDACRRLRLRAGQGRAAWRATLPLGKEAHLAPQERFVVRRQLIRRVASCQRPSASIASRIKQLRVAAVGSARYVRVPRSESKRNRLPGPRHGTSGACTPASMQQPRDVHERSASSFPGVHP